jgi:hypothetical protein
MPEIERVIPGIGNFLKILFAFIDLSGYNWAAHFTGKCPKALESTAIGQRSVKCRIFAGIFSKIWLLSKGDFYGSSCKQRLG